jgi:hypothetical protein
MSAQTKASDRQAISGMSVRHGAAGWNGEADASCLSDDGCVVADDRLGIGIKRLAVPHDILLA